MTQRKYTTVKAIYRTGIRAAGIRGSRIYMAMTLIAMMALPIIIKGRNLPILVLVRSIRAPMMGSVMASQTRITVTIKEANMPSASTLEPNWAI